MAQFGNGAERIILLDMILRVVLGAQFEADAVDAFNPDAIATRDGWLVGDAVCGSGRGESLASATLGQRCGRSSVPGVDLQRRRLRTRPNHRPVSRRYRKPHLVAGGKYRTCIVEPDADAVAFTYRQQSGLFVVLAMSEVEHTKADTQRFTGRVQVA